MLDELLEEETLLFSDELVELDEVPLEEELSNGALEEEDELTGELPDDELSDDELSDDELSDDELLDANEELLLEDGVVEDDDSLEDDGVLEDETLDRLDDELAELPDDDELPSGAELPLDEEDPPGEELPLEDDPLEPSELLLGFGEELELGGPPDDDGLPLDEGVLDED